MGLKGILCILSMHSGTERDIMHTIYAQWDWKGYYAYYLYTVGLKGILCKLSIHSGTERNIMHTIYTQWDWKENNAQIENN